MWDERITVGSVVQLDPERHLGEAQGFFAGCFLLVTELKDWGVMGFVAMPGERGTMPGSAYFRAPWDALAYVGEAVWMPADEGGDGEAT